MNTVWSSCIQGTNTLYYSRKLRFDDRFSAQYKTLFNLYAEKELNILEIGCGPGALAGALLRWYPNAHITAIDRDSAFVAFARLNEKGIDFSVGDATALPFAENTFDVTISNTVAEHIDPQYFYAEQLRVLKPGGICLVLSARKGIHIDPPCITYNEFENAFWKKVEQNDTTMEQYEVCKYPMSESQLPAVMQQHGFIHVSTGYAVINLTPDDPDVPKEMAYAMLRAERESALDGIRNIQNSMPMLFSQEEFSKMLKLTNEKYDLRQEQYDRGEKQWDTQVSLTMVIRGVKA